MRKHRNFAALFVAAFLLPAVSCIPPQSFQQVKQSRTGQAIGDKVAVVYSTHYQINMGGAERLHPFDIRKYAKIYLQLKNDGLIRPEDVFVPEAATEEQILLVHSREFLRSLKDSKKVAEYLEAPVVGAAPAGLVDAGILNAFRYATGGTILAGREALKYGIGINLAGGYHHAKPNAGEGFNIYADIAIAIRVLQREGLIKRAAIIDLDVHQGNGDAVIFAGDTNVYTFSMHENDIYPIPKEHSDWDIELPRGTTDEAYLRHLMGALPRIFDDARPDIVFIQGGCDTLAGDPLAGMEMTPQGIAERDSMVVDECVQRNIPVVMTLGGGYSEGAWEAQYASIRRIIIKHGLNGRPIANPRTGKLPTKATAKERLYVK